MDLKFGGATYSTMQQITGHIFHMDFFSSEHSGVSLMSTGRWCCRSMNVLFN